MTAARCSFCTAQLADVGRLIQGPAVSICDRCTAGAIATADDSKLTECNFCRAPVIFALRASDHAICEPCIELCVDILREANAQLPRAIVIPRKN